MLNDLECYIKVSFMVLLCSFISSIIKKFAPYEPLHNALKDYILTAMDYHITIPNLRRTRHIYRKRIISYYNVKLSVNLFLYK